MADDVEGKAAADARGASLAAGGTRWREGNHHRTRHTRSSMVDVRRQDRCRGVGHRPRVAHAPGPRVDPAVALPAASGSPAGTSLAPASVVVNGRPPERTGAAPASIAMRATRTSRVSADRRRRMGCPPHLTDRPRRDPASTRTRAADADQATIAWATRSSSRTSRMPCSTIDWPISQSMAGHARSRAAHAAAVTTIGPPPRGAAGTRVEGAPVARDPGRRQTGIEPQCRTLVTRRRRPRQRCWPSASPRRSSS